MAFAAGVNISLPAVMSAADTNWPAVTATPLFVSVPGVGSVVIFTASRALAGVSFGIAEAEVGRRERVGRVLVGGHRLVGARRRVVDRRDVDGDRVRRLVEVDAAVGGAAVVLHLEREARVARRRSRSRPA